MFTFEVDKNEIKMTEHETVTSGSVNAYICQFTFSDDWKGLAKTITFRAGDVSISVLLNSTNICSIPWEVLEKDAVQLYAGVRGTVIDTDTEEEAVIPTVYCLLGTIRKGTELGDNSRPPEPSIVDQIMNKLETLDKEKQDKLTGAAGQVVSFDENGNVIARDEKGTEYKAGENISISEDNTISATMYDDTEIRGEIDIVKSKAEANAAGIAENAEDIAKNAEATERIAANIAKNTEAIAKNTTDMAKNSGDLKSVSDKVDTLTSSFSTLSSSVTNNAEAISKANSDISELSSSVTSAEELIAKNTKDISSANSAISGLSENKQDKLTGTKGQVVGFDDNGNPIAQEYEAGEKYTAGANISISEDNVISADMYDDTELRAEIDANSSAIADAVTNINSNSEAIRNISDKSAELETAIDSLSSSVADNAEAISKANEDISALSSSVIAAEGLIAKNATDISTLNSTTSGLSESKQDKLTGTKGQVVGFDDNGNPIAQEGGSGTPGKDGTTFTPMVSPEGVISWTNDGGKENPEAVNIRGPIGPAGSYTAGENIEISEDNVISAKSYDDTALKSDIAKNTAAINSMKSDISANTSAIEATNANVSEISSSLQSAKSDISANTSAIETANANISSLEASKQDKLTGTSGQIVSFDELGNVIARDEKGTEYKAGENISISADNTISATMYDDTEIRGEINSVKSKAEANSTNIAKNTADINTNAEAIAENTAGIASNTANISANTANIAKNTADINTNAEAIAKNAGDVKTVSDKVDTLTSSFSTLSSSVADNSEAISKANSDISSANSAIAGLSESKQNKITGVKGQVVGFDDEGNPVAQEYEAGEKYTAGDNISISEDNVISATAYDDTEIKSQISTLENNVNTSLDVFNQRINSKQNALSTGYGINISGSTIEFSATASTRFLYTANGMNTGGTTISSITNFSVTSQTSNLSTVFEYMRIGTGTSIRACYSFEGNLSATIKASVAKTYFAGNPISITMSQSASFTAFAGFATIIVSGTTHLCLVKTGGGKTLTLYPTEEFTISSGTSATLGLYL